MKPHTAGLDETAIPHIKIKITEILLEEKLNTVNPHVPLHNTLDMHCSCIRQIVNRS